VALSLIIKRFALVKAPRFFRGKFQIMYWILLSNCRRLALGGERIVRVEKVEWIYKGEKIWLFRLELSDGIFWVQNVSRISRFIGGRQRSFERICEIYYLNQSNLQDFLSKEDLVVFDVGANIGEFTFGFIDKRPNSQVFAFEPDPIAFECLKRNISELKLEEKVFAMPFALTTEESEVNFFRAYEEADSSLIPPLAKSKLIRVRGRRLDAVLMELDLDFVDLIKMDAEGSEPEVLIGLGKGLQNVNMLTIDVGAERLGVDSEDEVKAILQPFDFSIDVINSLNDRRILLAKAKGSG